mmetsp:Transcript_67269/g.157837  ORF Transcript_67269/g.157837 Transcript_67269/m.157837 type:complete len:234 (-) Transcript_67269:42-743(-)
MEVVIHGLKHACELAANGRLLHQAQTFREARRILEEGLEALMVANGERVVQALGTPRHGILELSAHLLEASFRNLHQSRLAAADRRGSSLHCLDVLVQRLLVAVEGFNLVSVEDPRGVQCGGGIVDLRRQGRHLSCQALRRGVGFGSQSCEFLDARLAVGNLNALHVIVLLAPAAEFGIHVLIGLLLLLQGGLHLLQHVDHLVDRSGGRLAPCYGQRCEGQGGQHGSHRHCLQ